MQISLLFKVIFKDNLKKGATFIQVYGRILDKVIVMFKAGNDVFALGI